MIRRCIRNLTADGEHPAWESIIPYMVGNIGFVFTTGDLTEIEDVIKEFVKPAAATRAALRCSSCVRFASFHVKSNGGEAPAPKEGGHWEWVADAPKEQKKDESKEASLPSLFPGLFWASCTRRTLRLSRPRDGAAG